MLPQCLLIQSMQPAGQVVTRCLPWFAQIVVDFSATWCGPCRLISPYFDELSAQYPGIIFLKVDVDAVDVRSLPSVQLFRGHVAGFEQQMSAFWLLQLVERKEPHRLLRGVGRFHRGGHQRYADFPGTLSPNEYSLRSEHGLPAAERCRMYTTLGTAELKPKQAFARLAGLEGWREGGGACGCGQRQAQGDD